MKTDIDKLQAKRNYIERLESIQDNLWELYNYGDISELRDMWDTSLFTGNLDVFIEAIANEITHQYKKLDVLETKIYKNSKNN